MEKINILISFNYHSFFYNFSIHSFLPVLIYSFPEQATTPRFAAPGGIAAGESSRARRRQSPAGESAPTRRRRGVGPSTPRRSPLAAVDSDQPLLSARLLGREPAIPAVTNLGDLGSAEAELYGSISSPSNAASC
ncbi:hypothetical protein PVAP13_7KG063929 [Panicum virgatum]|uniref:Uncharacterized protein n=1 Tax=Panicum virgatum TaxID=38727 RepID=A0A8T0QE12_PANVG|nr:hypothetical protein PVAP13_7KG063929 [Panicum virgatum]